MIDCRIRRALGVSVLAVLLSLSSCTQIKQLEYGPFIRELDGLSELAITTYPADFPDRRTEKGAVFEQYETAHALYLQVHIRDEKKKFGPNPHVQSIVVHHFAYQIGDAAPVVMLSGYQDNFWMQGNPRYEASPSPALPFLPEGKISIEISLTLNGEYYEFTGDMPANEKSTIWPTVIVEQGV